MIRPYERFWSWTPLAPILCAIHCAATPVLVAFVPALSPVEALEIWFLGLTALVAGIALAAGLRNHKGWWVVAPVGLGLAVWGASLGHVFHPVPEPLATSVGALVVAGGLVWNTRLYCREEPEAYCSCPSCEDRTEVPSEPRRSWRPADPQFGAGS